LKSQYPEVGGVSLLFVHNVFNRCISQDRGQSQGEYRDTCVGMILFQRNCEGNHGATFQEFHVRRHSCLSYLRQFRVWLCPLFCSMSISSYSIYDGWFALLSANISRTLRAFWAYRFTALFGTSTRTRTGTL
jgi:hypothetical protein